MCPSPPTTNIREFLSTTPPNYWCLLPSACVQDQGWPTPTFVGLKNIINQITRIQFDGKMKVDRTRQSKHWEFSTYMFDNSKSKSMVRLVRAEKMVLSGLVFARKIARMILIQNIQGLMGPLMINMAFMPLYMWEMWDVTPVTHGHTDGRTVESRAVFSWTWIRKMRRRW